MATALPLPLVSAFLAGPLVVAAGAVEEDAAGAGSSAAVEAAAAAPGRLGKMGPAADLALPLALVTLDAVTFFAADFFTLVVALASEAIVLLFSIS